MKLDIHVVRSSIWPFCVGRVVTGVDNARHLFGAVVSHKQNSNSINQKTHNKVFIVVEHIVSVGPRSVSIDFFLLHIESTRSVTAMPGFGRFSRGKPQLANMDQHASPQIAAENAAMAPPDDTAWMQFDQHLDFGNDETFDSGNFDSSSLDFSVTTETPAAMHVDSMKGANPAVGLAKFKAKTTAAAAPNDPQGGALENMSQRTAGNTAPLLVNGPAAQLATTPNGSSFERRHPTAATPLAGAIETLPTSNCSGVSMFANGRTSALATNQDMSITTREATTVRTNMPHETRPSSPVAPRPTNTNGAPIFGERRSDHGPKQNSSRLLDSTSSTRVLPLPAIAKGPSPVARLHEKVTPRTPALSNGRLRQTTSPKNGAQSSRSGPIPSTACGAFQPTTPKNASIPPHDTIVRAETPQPITTEFRPATSMHSVTPSPTVMVNQRFRLQNHAKEAIPVTASVNSSKPTHTGDGTSTLDFGDLHAKFLTDIRDLEDLQDCNSTRLLTMESMFATAYSVTLNDQAQFLDLIDQLEDLTSEGDKKIAKFQDF